MGFNWPRPGQRVINRATGKPAIIIVVSGDDNQRVVIQEGVQRYGINLDYLDREAWQEKLL